MNFQSLVVIFLRLIALKFLLNIVVQIMTQVTVGGGYPDSSPFSNPVHASYVLLMAGFITGAIMLWTLALPIAQLVTRGLPQEMSLGGLSRAEVEYDATPLGLGWSTEETQGSSFLATLGFAAGIPLGFKRFPQLFRREFHFE